MISLFRRDIANGREHFPIRCVNEIDDEAPRKFTYITENRYDNGIYVDSDLRHKEVSSLVIFSLHILYRVQFIEMRFILF